MSLEIAYMIYVGTSMCISILNLWSGFPAFIPMVKDELAWITQLLDFLMYKFQMFIPL